MGLEDDGFNAVIEEGWGLPTAVVNPLLVGLVGWWRLDDGVSGTTPTTAADSSGNGNIGNLFNGPTWGPGKIGNALSFVASNLEYVNVGNPTVLRLGNVGSFAFWLKVPSNATNVYLSKNDAETDRNGYAAYSVGGGDTMRVEICNATASIICGSNNVAIYDNTWHHIAATWLGNNLRLYVDAAEDPNSPSFTGGLVPTSSVWNLNFGRDTGSANYYVDGSMDDIRIYNRALSASDVVSLYNWRG